MPTTAQVVGQTKGANVILFRLKDRLKLVGVQITHPMQNRLYQREYSNLSYDPSVWSEYEVTLSLYEAIKNSCLHVVTNDISGIVDKEMALTIMLAMTYDKPIVLTYKPYFKPDVPADWSNIIEARADKLQVRSLLKLDNTLLKDFVKSTCSTTVDYKLKKAEKTTIQAALQAHLSQLLKQSS